MFTPFFVVSIHNPVIDSYSAFSVYAFGFVNVNESPGLYFAAAASALLEMLKSPIADSDAIMREHKCLNLYCNILFPFLWFVIPCLIQMLTYQKN